MSRDEFELLMCDHIVTKRDSNVNLRQPEGFTAKNIDKESRTVIYEILHEIDKHTGYSYSELSKCHANGKLIKERDYVIPRQLCYWYCKAYTNLSLQKIGNTLWDQNHATILNSIRVINNLRETNKDFSNRMDMLTKDIERKIKLVTYYSQEKNQ